MKKTLLILLLIIAAFFQFCSSTKKAQMNVPSVSYAANVQPIIAMNCSPCHIPPGGKEKALNTYEAAKTNADDMIARIQKSPDEKGFMPFKHPKLSDSVINVFVQWKNNGFAEN
ncbi:MAG: hypothetical protein M3Y85_10570 [Bacteroidota bacterium]|nr:hypothetical protein [Bacteroidota bacterium]